MIAIDLFAGVGGLSLGAEQAGVHVTWAANHWPAAVQAYKANHPSTVVQCQDLHLADFTSIAKYDILLASPACQGHTWARGKDRPHHDAARATAWAVVAAAEVGRPEFVVVENCVQMKTWALYPVWEQALQTLGYSIATVVVDAADLGVPQHRERLFVVATKGKHAIDIHPPEPMEHVPAAVDFDSGTWSTIDTPTRAKATVRRIEAGRRTYGERFLLAYYGSEAGGRSLQRPLGTIRTRGAHALVDHDRMRMLTVPELKACMGFPASYVLPTGVTLATHLLGNAVCPAVGKWVVEQVVR